MVFGSSSVVKGFADITGPQRAGDLVEDSTTRGVVRMLGQVRRGGRESVSEAGDSLPGDREVFEVGLGLPQPSLQFGDLSAETVGWFCR
ncbi:hypothetical protein [Streptomyces coeruleorubidus]|uniref:hypothetical protein n=1 Tax=Streptomyces coeruleorubidus TaxID=116188 RepID=UPI0036525D62